VDIVTVLVNLLSATEMAESLGINQKTFYRWRESGNITPKGGDEKRPLFDLDDGVSLMVAKGLKIKGKRCTREMFLESVLRRWKSKTAISRQSLENHEEAYVDYSELGGLWHSMVGRAISEIEKLPSTIARKAAGVEDIATVSEIVRKQVYATLNTLAGSDENEYIDSLADVVEESSIEASDGADISDLIEIERTLQNNLVSRLNERRALVAAGKLLNAELAEKAMGDMVSIARSKLLALPGGFARLIASQERAAIVKILKEELKSVTAELKPDLPAGAIESDVFIVQDDEDEEND
jgi:hypothetical protein